METKEERKVTTNSEGSKFPLSNISNEITTSSNVIGLKGIVCGDCLNSYLAPLLRHPDPKLESSFHVCVEDNKFGSEESKADHRKKSEKDIVDLLLRSVRAFHPDGKIALAAVNTKLYDLDLKREQQLAIMHNNGKGHEHYISRAIREKVTTLDDNTELQDFFEQTHATYGLYEIAGTGDQYAVFICGSVKEEENTSSNNREDRGTTSQENKTAIVPCLNIRGADKS
jgi:hypothetical protein